MKNTSKDSLGDRMKGYEEVTRYRLSHKSYVIGRIDGNAFSTYTKKLKLKRPFDDGFVADMNATAIYLCQKLQNVKFAYVQSDEISLLMHDEGQDTQPWFNNILQKMASIAASKATTEFNRRRIIRSVEDMFNYSVTTISAGDKKMFDRAKEYLEFFTMAEFDARFWTVPSAIEAYNSFLWRQQDAEKNAISAVANANFPHKQLEGVNGLQKKEMLRGLNIEFDNFDLGLQRGRFIEKVTYINDQPGKILKNEEGPHQYELLDVIYQDFVAYPELKPTDVIRSYWEVVPHPKLTDNPDFLMRRIKGRE